MNSCESVERKHEAARIPRKDVHAVRDLLRGKLKSALEEQFTIDVVLGSEWMATWALPQSE